MKVWLEQQGRLALWQVASAGVDAFPGIPATENARMVMVERNCNLNDHRSQPVTEELMVSFGLVLVMEQWHQQRLQLAFPAHSAKVHHIRWRAGRAGDVEDPVGLSLEAYRQTADELQLLLEANFRDELRS